uniref:Uncharacterized protein n=1 Tax=Cycas taitungensis TaxID=54799 RepID=A6H5F4_CYCTA|nr:hypothetical protein CYtaCp012 [Cycas taitungensis]BAF64920.1 hypothetical protein [Cycas taitungensis]
MVNSAAISSIDCSPIVQLYNNSAGTTKNSRCSLFKYQSDYGGKLFFFFFFYALPLYKYFFLYPK